MRRISVLVLLSLLLPFLVGCHRNVNNSIVKIFSEQGSCTAFEAKAPSGKQYTLTAAHCSILADENQNVEALLENNAVVSIRVIAISPTADMLVLEGIPSLPALEIGEHTFPGEHIHVIGHGYGLPLWEVDGNIIGYAQVFNFIETFASAPVAPGHSGSPALDPENHVIGIVSVGNGQISGLVSINDIIDMLRGY